MTAKSKAQLMRYSRDKKRKLAKSKGLVEYRGWVTPEAKAGLVKIEIEYLTTNGE